MVYIKWLLTHIRKKYRVFLYIGLLLAALASVMQLIDPWLTSKLYDDVIIAKNPAPLIPILAMMLGVQILRTGIRHLMIVLLEKSSQQMILNVRADLFRKLQFQDVPFYDQYRTGDLMTRLQGDLDYCRHVMAWSSFMLVESATLLIAALIFFFFQSPELTLMLLAVVPATVVVLTHYRKKVRGGFREMRERMAQMNAAAQENITANRVVKAFVREEYEIERFDEKNRSFRQIHLKLNKRWLTVFPIMESLVVVMSMITVFVGGYFIMDGRITAGQLAMFTTLSFALSGPLRMVGPLMDDMQRCASSAQKIMEIHYAEPTIVDADNAISHDTMRGDITFEGVTFGYDAASPVLKDVSFSIPAGGTLAIMGPTGSGKSTLIHLISRLYDVNAGRILIDGDDIRKWKLQELRSKIGVATQEVFLFSDSIENNIAFSDFSMSEEEARDFAKRAAVSEFTRRMPEGYETVVGERGVGLSGGQRQRIALARAMAAKPAILILDDTTSALDMETEKYIQEELRRLPFTCTKIIIGQRISSVKDADLILVLGNGGIAEMGTHEQLVKNGGYYFETYALQNDIPLTGGELQ